MVKKPKRVVTFYSYKGGVGRSMAMANVGALLAKWGLKTLLIDWDLEAPGLENYFRAFLNVDETRQKLGLIDLLYRKKENPAAGVSEISWDEYITPVRLNQESELFFMGAGRQDAGYVQKVRQFDFIAFYEDHDGGQYIEDLREHWLDNFDFVLIDSRTGLTDSSGICSIHMPDILVLLFTPNQQSFAGTKDVSAKAIEAQKNILFDRFRLRTLPVPSRIENAETTLLDTWMRKIYNESDDMLQWLPKREDRRTEFLITPAQFLNQLKIPYKTLYAYGESLPVCDRGTADPLDIGYVYETIAAVLANDLQNTHLLIDSRDALVKKAKGEEILDQTDFYRKIEIEKEEVKRVEEEKKKIELEKAELENELQVQAKQADLHRIEYASKEDYYRKRKSKIMGYAVLLALVLAAGVYFLARNKTSVKAITDTSLTDTLEKTRRYTSFIAEYTNSEQQSDVRFNLAMLRKYYQFDKGYQDSLNDFKQRIEKAVSYKFQNVLDSFYGAVRQQMPVQKYLADTLKTFGSQSNVPSSKVNAGFLAAYKAQKITNIPDTAFSPEFFTDTAGIHIRYREKGNALFDGFTVYKKVASTNVITFDTSFRISSLLYEAVNRVSDTVVVELFFCKDIDGKGFATGNRIAAALRTKPNFKVYTSTNFISATDPLSPYYIQSNQIRYDRNSEQKLATDLQALIYSATKTKFDLYTTRTVTPNYISVFICGSAGDATNIIQQKASPRIKYGP